MAEREDSQNGREANAPRIRQSRAARVMSLKNDLVCIKDVAAYHDVHQAEKRANSLSKSTYPSTAFAGLNEKDSQLIKNAFKQLYQAPKGLVDKGAIMRGSHTTPGTANNIPRPQVAGGLPNGKDASKGDTN